MSTFSPASRLSVIDIDHYTGGRRGSDATFLSESFEIRQAVVVRRPPVGLGLVEVEASQERETTAVVVVPSIAGSGESLVLSASDHSISLRSASPPVTSEADRDDHDEDEAPRFIKSMSKRRASSPTIPSFEARPRAPPPPPLPTSRTWANVGISSGSVDPATRASRSTTMYSLASKNLRSARRRSVAVSLEKELMEDVFPTAELEREWGQMVKKGLVNSPSLTASKKSKSSYSIHSLLKGGSGSKKQQRQPVTISAPVSSTFTWQEPDSADDSGSQGEFEGQGPWEWEPSPARARVSTTTAKQEFLKERRRQTRIFSDNVDLSALQVAPSPVRTDLTPRPLAPGFLPPREIDQSEEELFDVLDICAKSASDDTTVGQRDSLFVDVWLPPAGLGIPSIFLQPTGSPTDNVGIALGYPEEISTPALGHSFDDPAGESESDLEPTPKTPSVAQFTTPEENEQRSSWKPTAEDSHALQPITAEFTPPTTPPGRFRTLGGASDYFGSTLNLTPPGSGRRSRRQAGTLDSTMPLNVKPRTPTKPTSSPPDITSALSQLNLTPPTPLRRSRRPSGIAPPSPTTTSSVDAVDKTEVLEDWFDAQCAARWMMDARRRGSANTFGFRRGSEAESNYSQGTPSLATSLLVPSRELTSPPFSSFAQSPSRRPSASSALPLPTPRSPACPLPLDLSETPPERPSTWPR